MKRMVLYIALMLAATPLAADRGSVECRAPDDPALYKDIRSREDAVVLRYFASELVNAYTVEYLNCRTGAAISVYDGKGVEGLPKRSEEIIRQIIKLAIESPVSYTRAQVIDAIEEAGFEAKPGTLQTTICACAPDVRKKAARRW